MESYVWLILIIVTWGVIGGYASSNIGVTCDVPVGPLCFVWHRNVLGQMGEVFQEVATELQKQEETWKAEHPPELVPLDAQTCDKIIPDTINMNDEMGGTFTAEWGEGFRKHPQILSSCRKGKQSKGENEKQYYCDASVYKNDLIVKIDFLAEDSRGDTFNVVWKHCAEDRRQI